MSTAMREAAIWALAAALALELGSNLIAERTIWHRLDAIEQTLERMKK